MYMWNCITPSVDLDLESTSTASSYEYIELLCSIYTITIIYMTCRTRMSDVLYLSISFEYYRTYSVIFCTSCGIAAYGSSK